MQDRRELSNKQLHYVVAFSYLEHGSEACHVSQCQTEDYVDTLVCVNLVKTNSTKKTSLIQ